MENLKEIVVDLMLENKRLTKELKKSEDTQMYWYKEYDKLKVELKKQTETKTS